jgi:hypothetical protein
MREDRICTCDDAGYADFVWHRRNLSDPARGSNRIDRTKNHRARVNDLPAEEVVLGHFASSYHAITPGWSANRKLSRNGLMGSAECGFRVQTKVNSLWPNPQLVIALHSPSALLETGLRRCLPEKSQDSGPLALGQSILSSPVCGRNIAKYGHVSRILRQRPGSFSALHTA